MMNKKDKILNVADKIKDAHELADDLGLLDRVKAWWRGRPRVQKRRARREARRS